MKKTYPTSLFYRIFTLGIYLRAASIDGDILHVGFADPIEISKIQSVTCKSIPVRYYRTTSLYVYRFQLHRSHVDVTYSAMEGYVLKELVNDLKSINPGIETDESIIKTLNFIGTRTPVKFNFTPPPKGQRLIKDAQFTQEYPSRNAFIGLSTVGLYFVLPLLFFACGGDIITAIHGAGYGDYRNAMAVLCGLSLATLLMNFLFALGSQYLGHKVTIITAALTLIFLLVAIL